MFGGNGLYVDDLFVGILDGDTLFLKCDEGSRTRFEAAGCHPFSFDTREGRKVVLGFWSAPDDALESPVLMQPWARIAMEAALKARNAKPVAKKKAAAKTKKSVRVR
jgi:DNA transformation protein